LKIVVVVLPFYTGAIKTRIRKDKLKARHKYKKKQLRIRKDKLILTSF